MPSSATCSAARADIAVRHVKPDQPDPTPGLLRGGHGQLHASEDWVRVHGHPRHAEEAAHPSFVGADRSGHFLAYLHQQGLPLSEANFSCYADHRWPNGRWCATVWASAP